MAGPSAEISELRTLDFCDAGDPPNPAIELFVEGVRAVQGVAQLMRIEPHVQDVGGIEAEVHLVNSLKRAHHQPGPREKNDRHGCLQDDEQISDAPHSGSFTQRRPAFLKPRVDLRS